MDSLRKLNRKLLLVPKLLFLFVNLQYYTLHVFRGPFIKERSGVGDGMLGMYSGLILFVVFFTNIFFGTMNDKFGRTNMFIVGALVATCIFVQLFFVDPYIGLFPSMFWVNLFFYMCFNNCLPPILDKALLDYLNGIPEAGGRAYGRQKMWGTIGYCLSTFLIERCVTSGSKSNFNNLRYYSIVTTSLAATLVFFMLKSTAAAGDRRGARNDIVASFRELMRNGSYFFFIFIILLNGVTRQGLSFYLTLYTREILEVKGYNLPSSWPSWFTAFVNLFNKSPIGTITTFGAFFEVITLYNFPMISRRIGLIWPLFIAHIFQLLRMCGYYILDHKNPHVFAYCCILELTRGLYFGMLHPAAVQLATNLCPPHLKSTSQMIYQGTFTALGAAVGGLLFGCLFSDERMKDKNLPVEEKAADFSRFFLFNIVLVIVATVLFAAKHFVVEPFRRRHSADAEKKAIIEAQS